MSECQECPNLFENKKGEDECCLGFAGPMDDCTHAGIAHAMDDENREHSKELAQLTAQVAFIKHELGRIADGENVKGYAELILATDTPETWMKAVCSDLLEALQDAPTVLFSSDSKGKLAGDKGEFTIFNCGDGGEGGYIVVDGAHNGVQARVIALAHSEK